MDKDVAINYTPAYKGILKGLSQSSSIGALTYRKGKIEFVNQYLVELLEYKSKKEIVGKPIEEVIEGKGEEFINTASVEYRTLSLKSKTKELIPAEAFSYSIQYGDETITLMIFINKSKEASFRKLFLALTQISQLSAIAESEKELISGICNTMVEVVGYYSATIGVVDEKTIEIWEKLYTKTLSENESILKIFLKKGGVNNGVKYNRLSTVKFPLYSEILSADKDTPVAGIKLRNKDIIVFKLLFQYLISWLEEDDKYVIGSTDGESPGFIALFKSYIDLMDTPIKTIKYI